MIINSAVAQIPAKCFEIESILVDACNATSLEPNNEMVRFRVGPNPISIANIGIYGQGATGPYVLDAWPTTTIPWLGLIQNATTASATAALQATVVASCGRLLEPPGGIIPQGANVLMIASTNPSTVDNSFSTLTDTLYVVYHNANYTVTTGHFKNWASASSTRSFILANTATGCTDTATYDVSLLTGISGGNGDRVDFSWPGVQTYLNNGCNAPFVPITADAGSVISGCVGSPINLAGTATGNFIGLVWQSAASGTFSASNSLTTTYTPASTGTYTISFGAITPCHDTVFSVLTFTALSIPSASITASGSTTICAGDSVILAASGGDSYLWSNGAITPSITAFASGTYILSATNGCGTDTSSIIVTTINPPSATISASGPTTICVGDNVTLNATGSSSYIWSTGATGNSINVSNAGTYFVVVTNSCGTDTASLQIMTDSVNAFFTGDTFSGNGPLTVNFVNASSSNAITYSWTFGDGNTSNSFSPTNTFQTPGVYNVTLTVTNSNGCSDTYSIQVTVLENPSVLIIPNVFSPNNDGNNDLFFVKGAGLKDFDCAIYDRWGLKVNELTSISMGWDGRTEAGKVCSDGTYYYVIKATGFDNKVYNKTGFVLLTR